MQGENNVERLKKRLYQKGESFGSRLKRERLKDGGKDKARDYWRKPDFLGYKSEKPRLGLLKIFIVLAVVFLFISSAVAAYLLFGGTNTVSARNINMEIKGPVYADAGKPIDFSVFIENKNAVALELSDLIIEYPKGASDIEGSGKMKTRERYSLGKINPNETASYPIDIVLFGEKDEEKKIIATLEYRLEDSNAIFAKTEEYSLIINSSAIGISISAPKETRSNQEMILDVEIVSNSEIAMRNLILLMEYPSGFQFVSASPNPIDGGEKWMIGDLGASKKRNIRIKGIVEGQDLDEKAFRAEVGVSDEDNAIIIYASESAAITIKKPLLDFSLSIDGYDGEKNTANAGQYIRGELRWKNNLPVEIRNASIEMKIIGKAVNTQSISASSGFYRDFDKTLVWNSSRLQKLKNINPGEEGKAQFSFSVFNPLPMNSDSGKNFIISLNGKIFGKRVLEGEGETEISNNFEKEIKIATNVQFVSRALYYSGAFENSGSVPPKVGEETTYTIVWSIANDYNDASDVFVRASLPSYIRWIDNVFPQEENVEFDESTGEAVWNAGDVLAGTGIARPAKEVSFQIGFTPSMNQIGSSPTLIFGSVLEAHDNFTDIDLSETKPALNTNLKSDAKFKYGDDKVIK